MSARASPLIVGVGGATCSGKTTLSKHLLAILSASSLSSFILHQDDFAPLESTLPLHASGQRDWDAPRTAIDYERMLATLRHVKAEARMPDGFSSHDHLNKQPACPIPSAQAQRWAAEFRQVIKQRRAQYGSADVVIVDGFLLYYNRECSEALDVRLFLRTDMETLKKRREERNGYATAEGTVWQDPPGYFETVVWPAYVEAHGNVFKNGDLDHGSPAPSSTGQQQTDGAPVPGLVLLDARATRSEDLPRHLQEEVEAEEKAEVSIPMSLMVERSCQAILERLMDGKGADKEQRAPNRAGQQIASGPPLPRIPPPS